MPRSIDVSIRFYEVAQLGYYQWGSDIADWGSIEGHVAQLHDWVHDQPNLTLTQTFTPPSDDEDHAFPMLCMDMLRRDGGDDYLFVAFNQLRDNDERGYRVDPRKKVGTARLKRSGRAGSDLEGLPTWFWLLPSRSLVATVAPKGAKLKPRISDLLQYLRGFLVINPNHRVELTRADGTEWSDYRKSLAVKEDKRKHPRVKFATETYDINAIDDLLENPGKVEAIVGRHRITAQTPLKRKLLQEFFNPWADVRKLPSKAIQFDYAIKASPSKEDIKAIARGFGSRISRSYSTGRGDHTRRGKSDPSDLDAEFWGDEIGFALRGEPTFWLRSQRMQTSVSILVDEVDDVIDDGSLLSALDVTALVERARRGE